MFQFALKNLSSRPVRSLLALCGLTVAIAGMVGLFSVAEGIEESVSTTFGKVPGLAVMQPGAPIPLFSRLPTAWGREIEQLDGVHVVHPEVWTRAHVIEGQPTVAPPRFLFGSDLVVAQQLRYSVYREGVRDGRALTAADRGTLNALVSRAIADEHHKHVGDTLRVDSVDLTIVGIYDCHSMFLDVAIIFDIDEVRRLGRIGPESVCNFYVEPEPNVDREELAARIRDLFRGRAPEPWQPSSLAGAIESPAGENPLGQFVKGLAGSIKTAREANDNDDPAPDAAKRETEGAASLSARPRELPIEVRTSDDWAAEFKRFSADLDIFLLLMTGIGVTIAFVGIVNTMLMSVTERYVEFGILKANGWSNGAVLRLIAFESALLGLAGGFVGCLLGWIATHAINARWPTRIHLYASPQLLLFSIAFSAALGVLGGLYPAIRAARMTPMDAIRRG